MTYGFGRQMVAGLAGTSPESFTATVNIATLLISPIPFLIALAIGGIFIFILATQIGMFALTAVLPPVKQGRWKQAAPWICRFAALGIAAFGSWSLLNRSNGYTDWVGRRTAAYLYNFDMYQDIHYAMGKKEKMAFLPDGRLLIGQPKENGGYTFEIRGGTKSM